MALNFPLLRTLRSAFIAGLFLAPPQSANALTVSAIAFGGAVSGPFDLSLNIPGKGGATTNFLNIVDWRGFERDTKTTYYWNLLADANGKVVTNINNLETRKLTRLFQGNLGVVGRLFSRSAQSHNSGVDASIVALFQFGGNAKMVRAANGPGFNYTIKTTAKVEMFPTLTVPNIPNRLVFGAYLGSAKIEDPFHVTQADLSATSVDPADFDYYLPFELDEFSFQLNSDREYKVFLRNGGLERVLFSLTRSVIGGLNMYFDPNTAFYSLSSIDLFPDLQTAPQLDMNAFRASLLADLSSDGRLDTPFALGAVATGVSISGSPGAGLDIGFSQFEGEREMMTGLAPAPIPPAAFLGMTSIALMGALRGRRKRRLEQHA